MTERAPEVIPTPEPPTRFDGLFANQTLETVLDHCNFETVLDIGSGAGKHSDVFENHGKSVTSIDFGVSAYYQQKTSRRAIIQGDYYSYAFDEPFDFIWASHVLEHQPNPNLFLKKIHQDLKEGGWLAITVPPLKHEIVGGHVSVWNAGLLLYHLILAGFDCRHAAIKQYGYNISVVVQKKTIAQLPDLHYDNGDIDRLSRFFPATLGFEGFDGDVRELQWPPGQHLAQVEFAGQTLHLNRQWVHEREYEEFINKGTLSGPLAIDLWVFSSLVQPDDSVLDAGANIGFTSLLANLSGASEIHGFEPDPRLVEPLMANTGHAENIQVHPIALGANPGQLNLTISRSHNQGSTFSKQHLKLFPQVYENSTTYLVEVDSIDTLFPEKKFQLWKIDVEGAELELLQGAEQVLKNHCPDIVYIELYDAYFPPVDQLLQPHFQHAWRIICRNDGYGMLVKMDADYSRLEQDGLLAMPPSYIYSNRDLTDLEQVWTRSVLIDRR